jgi:hypothetical protein
LNNFANAAHDIANKYRVVSSAVKMMRSAKTAAEKSPEGEVPKPENLDAQGIGNMMETLWNITVVDVEYTIQTVCGKVLKDSSITKDERIKRAEGLLIMGEIFLAHANTAENGLKEIGAQFSPTIPQNQNQ